MGNIGKKFFLALGIILLLWLVGPIMQEYLLIHPYYGQFLSGPTKWQHISVLLLGCVCALFPVLYLAQAKKISFRSFFLLLWGGLWVFLTAYVGIKAELYGGAWLKALINTGFLLGLGTLFLAQLIAFGSWLQQRFVRLDIQSPLVMLLFSLGLGLIGFLSIEYVLMLLNIAFPIVNRLLWGAGVYLVRISRVGLDNLWRDVVGSMFGGTEKQGVWKHEFLYLFASIIVFLFAVSLFFYHGDSLWMRVMILLGGGLVWTRFSQAGSVQSLYRSFSRVVTLQGMADIALFVLLILCVWYLYNGFVLAYIPYPTAWDANHAYMFFPKMFALHDGYYRNEISMRTFGGIRSTYITFWFSLFSFSGGFFGISVDTIAIQMNFLSGLFVLIFGLGLIWTFVDVLRKYYKDTENAVVHRLLVILGGLLLFQWLSSGMGAFLVFIDNKTDMGVLAMVILALLSGFLFLREYFSSKDLSVNLKKRLVLSGIFFAFAVLAKPTAMFDVMNFFFLMRGLWFGSLGVLGGMLLVVGILSVIRMRGIQEYFSPAIGTFFAGIGAAVFGINSIVKGRQRILTYGKYLLLWGGSFLVVMVGMKLLYYVPDAYFYGNQDRGVKEWVTTLLLAQQSSGAEQPGPLLTQAQQMPLDSTTCSLSSEGVANTEMLYEDLRTIVGNPYAEDVGRYVGYGRKGNPSDQRRGILPFLDSRRARGYSEGCHPFSPFFIDSHDAVTLCQREEDWKSFVPERLQSVQAELREDGRAAELVGELLGVTGSASVADLTATYREQLLELDSIMQGESMKIVLKNDVDQNGTPISYREIYLPYKYLHFFNITFNWSLQNLSSYYTDIGITRLILIFLVAFGLIYGVVSRDRMVTSIHLVTSLGWLLWMVVGGGILWYGIGIIIRTILSVLSLIYALHRRHSDVYDHLLMWGFVGILVFVCIWQGWYNMVRISTQGGGGAFMWYKTNHGMLQEVDITPQGQVIPTRRPTGSFGRDEVFTLQFAHYNKFLDLVNARNGDEGALIAGTYARYFIDNQAGILDDQFLTQLRERFSDNNVCRSYLRLKDKNIRYLAIDPNIGTVVQGDGNQGLFERFFARLNPTTQEIEQHGTMSMLASLVQQGYIRYVSSNNLGAKYALTLPDTAFGGLSGDALTVMRAKMMVARFFQEQSILGLLVSVADQRVKNGMFFEDLADIMGATVRPETTAQIMQNTQLNAQLLTADEKRVLMQFFALRQQATTDAEQYQQTLQNIVMQSLGGGNQIIVMEVVQ